MTLSDRREHPFERTPTQDLIDELVRRDAWPPPPDAPIVLAPHVVLYPDEGLLLWYAEKYYFSKRLMRLFVALAQVHPRGYSSERLARHLYPWQNLRQGMMNIRAAVSDIRLLVPPLIGLVTSPTGSPMYAYYKFNLDAPWEPPNQRRRMSRFISRRSDEAYYVHTVQEAAT